jgi:hypothetical protein
MSFQTPYHPKSENRNLARLIEFHAPRRRQQRSSPDTREEAFHPTFATDPTFEIYPINSPKSTPLRLSTHHPETTQQTTKKTLNSNTADTVL